MADPFARGWDRTDMYAAAVVGLAQIFNRPADAFALLDSIEPGSHFENTGMLDTPDVIVSTTEHYVFVSIAVTQGWQQWVLNVLGSVQVPAPSLSGFVSAWFNFAAATIFGVINPIVSPSLATKRLVFMGHSLGGAIAQILTNLYWNRATAGITCYTLGSPRVGDPLWAVNFEQFIFRCEDTDDAIVAVPPVEWGGIAIIPGMPGPTTPYFWAHHGTAQTLDADGGLTAGSNPPPLTSVFSQFAKRDTPSHYVQVYAERLRVGLPQQLTPGNTGYQSPSQFDAVFQAIAPASFPFLPPTLEGASDMNRFTLFFNIGTRAGYTEDFWADQSSVNWTSIVGDYLDARLALCASDVVFKYCRISNVPATRKVSWRSPSDFSTVVGGFSTASMAAPEQALDLRMTMDDLSPARIFLHGFPKSQFDGENYSPTTAFYNKFQVFRNLIKNGIYQFESLATPNTPDLRFQITSVAPQAPRGCVVNLAEVLPVVVGDTVQIGGQGARVLGLNGRKKVLKVFPGGNSILIGGAEPVGNPTDLAAGAYLYRCVFQFQAAGFAQIVGLTTHKVGRPFGVRPGRRENTIPLRQ